MQILSRGNWFIHVFIIAYFIYYFLFTFTVNLKTDYTRFAINKLVYALLN